MERKTISVGSYGVNCTILWDNQCAWIIDPGQEPDRIIDLLAVRGLTPVAILLTHAHFDHISGITRLQEKFPSIDVYAQKEDWVMFGHPYNQYGSEYPGAKPTNLKDILCADVPGLKVIETPGHTRGGVCLYFENEKWLFTGDTLFAGCVGRTDFVGGSMADMINSLKKLTVLPGETTVIPGHGAETTIQKEKTDNPYLV